MSSPTSGSPGEEPPTSPLEADRLQIRVVPYTPPRLSSDYSGSLHTNPTIGTPSPRYSPGSPAAYRSVSPADSEPNVATFSAEATPVPTGPSIAERQGAASTTTRPSTSSSSTSTRRQTRAINVHADKTFSLVEQPEPVPSLSSSSYSRFSSTLGSSSRGRLSSGTFSQQPSTSLTAYHEGSMSSRETYRPASMKSLDSPSESSPWNYKFIGGVRKVSDKSPTRSQTSTDSPLQEPERAYSPTPGPTRTENWTMSGALRSKSSLNSSVSGSILSDRTNIRVYAPRTPNVRRLREPTPAESVNISPATLDSTSNVRILGDSGSSEVSLDVQSRPRTEGSEPNLVRHGSHNSLSSVSTPRLRQQYSRESMVVPPLRPLRKLLTEPTKPGSPARESTGSGFLSVWSAMMNRDTARALFGGRISTPRFQSARVPSDTSSMDPRTAVMQHQWAAPLSTVFSESEGSSARLSRSLSPFSESNMEFHDNSLAKYITPDNYPGMDTVEETVEPPQPAFDRSKTSPNYKLVGDQDEHGDGLTDLRELIYHKPGRNRFPVLRSSHSDHSLWSNASNITNGINYWAIPAWARLYYGGGAERRFLSNQASYESMRSESSDGANGSLMRRTSSAERYAALFSAYRRNDQQAAERITPTKKSSYPDLGWIRTLKKQTSSLWSPHLRQDKRASSYTIWEPPVGVVSFEGKATGTRNLQVVLFIAGFVFPISWIIAALLPLPNHQQFAEKELQSTSQVDLPYDMCSHLEATNQPNMYSRAKWWRDLNRVMALVGFLVICAFVVLIVLGVKQKWE